MAEPYSTEPFPEHEDRRDFGNYLSGLTDGEGYFRLCMQRCPNRRLYPIARFSITLRVDDVDILRLIQSYLGCGSIYMNHRHAERRRKQMANPSYRLDVHVIEELTSRILPHFDAYRLRAKKRHDYQLWREAVLLIQHVNRSPRIPTGKCGGQDKWTPNRLARFRALMDALKAGRVFNAPNLPPPPPPPEEPDLFDYPDAANGWGGD